MMTHRYGLVLEGGAMRGMFTCGVIDTFLAAKIDFDGVVGVSAGAAFGCNYVSRQVGRGLRYNKLLAHDSRFCSVRSLLTTGDLFNAEFAYHTVPASIDVFDNDTFNSNKTAFHVVCTDVLTGKPVYRRLDRSGDEAFDWIRASASMPMCSRIVDIDGYRLLDGGIADSIPLQYFEDEGYTRNVVVLTQPAGYVKTPNKAFTLMRLWLRRYPRLVEALRTRHEMYNRQLAFVAEAERQGRAFVMRPPYPLPIGHISHDPDEMQRVYDIGVETARRRLDDVKKFIETT